MNNKQVAHLWANRSQSRATGSHFYFDGDVIYSYGSHFPIARHYKGVILFTSKRYSVTTSKHIGYAHSACSHLKSFTVEDVMQDPCAADLKNYRERVESLSMTAARARDPQWKLQMLEREVNEANSFAETFGFKTRFAMPDNFDALKAKAKEQSAKKAKATVARNSKIERYNAELVTRWLAGEQVSLPYAYSKVHLRAIGDTVETTKGAQVPLESARVTFRFINARRETGWHRNGDSHAIGQFSLDAVNAFGIVAGCHRIGWQEIESFAKSQGWTA